VEAAAGAAARGEADVGRGFVTRPLLDSPLPLRLRDALPALVAAMLAVLGVALVLGRVPLPGGDSFGFGSFARNVVIAAAVAHLVRAPGLRMSLSPLGTALLAYAAAAWLSVLVNGGSTSDVRSLATGVGLFFVTRALAATPWAWGRLLDGLGLVATGIALRELVSDPLLLLLRESGRGSLVTDHPNTLGFALALLLPLFLAAVVTGQPARRPRAALYAAAAAFGVLVTFSRAAWLASAVSAIAIATAASRQRLRSAITAALAGLPLAIAVAAAVSQMSLGRGEADRQRLRIIEASLTLFREHWPLGVGFGVKNLERLFPGRYIELYGSSLFLFHSHNFYVDALTGTGVIGAAATIWLVVRLVGLARRARRAEGDGLSHVESVAFAAAIATFLAIGLVDMPFYHARLTILFAVAFALVERRVELAEEGRLPAAGDARTLPS
jgi:O-antigen ligase